MSWTLRAVAVFVLLHGPRDRRLFALALAFLCAGAASAVLPVAPAGAATQAGAGAAILIASGVRAEQALAFAIASQALVIASGAVFALLFGGQLAGRRIRPLLARALGVVRGRAHGARRRCARRAPAPGCDGFGCPAPPRPRQRRTGPDAHVLALEQLQPLRQRALGEQRRELGRESLLVGVELARAEVGRSSSSQSRA